MPEFEFQKNGGGGDLMKTSEIYKRAQIAVINAPSICVSDKLEILRELMDKQDLEIFREQKEAEANQ